MKYTVGRNCVTNLNLDSIATCFGEDVRGGNLQVYVYANNDKKTLTVSNSRSYLTFSLKP